LRQNNTKKVKQSIDDKIIVKLKKAKGGSLFFVDDFLSFGTAKAVAKALDWEFKEALPVSN
jgi:5-formaminoimidazole-4-carboxamide-1-beta-D-ribofuranosyl 5'-monophosphate synthetase